MDLELIEKLLEMFARSPLAELELSENGWQIRLVRAGSAPVGTGTAGPAMPVHGVGPAAGTEPEGPSADAAAHVVEAGLVGTFYRRPAPDKEPFVTLGDLVEDGQTLGIMEAMKILIPVEADRAGRISAIFKDDGASVEAGEPLFAIVPAEGA